MFRIFLYSITNMVQNNEFDTPLQFLFIYNGKKGQLEQNIIGKDDRRTGYP